MKNGSRSVTLFPQRRKVEIAPGVRVAPLPKEEIPEIALARLQPVGDGTYRPILITYETDIRLTEAAKIVHVPYRTLLRLARAGFVKSTQPAPHFYQISLSFWVVHLKSIKDDPDFWSREKNQRRYREAL